MADVHYINQPTPRDSVPGTGSNGDQVSMMLSALRKTRQSISGLSEPFAVVHTACDLIDKDVHVNGCWALLFDHHGMNRTTTHAYSTIATSLFPDFVRSVETARCPSRIKEALASESVLVLDHSPDAQACRFLAETTSNGKIAVTRLAQDNQVFGLIGICYETPTVLPEMIGVMFSEFAADMASELHRIAAEDERRRLRDSLQMEKSRHTELFQFAPVGIIRTTPAGQIMELNRAAADIFGYANTAEAQQSITDIDETLYTDDGQLAELARQLKQTGITTDFELRARRNDGMDIWVSINSRLHDRHDGSPKEVFSFVRDVTRQREQEEQIRTTLKQKELLLREVHHRVKNNMSVIIGLLSLQRTTIRDTQTGHRACQVTEARIRAMAMIHELVYESAEIEAVDVGTCINRVIDIELSAVGNRVVVRRDIEPTNVTLDAAVPLGLIVHELVHNALVHAIDHPDIGAMDQAQEASPNLTVSISLSRLPDGSVELAVEDNGVGFDPPLGANPIGVGLQLVEALAYQLDGEFSVEKISAGDRSNYPEPLSAPSVSASSGRRSIGFQGGADQTGPEKAATNGRTAGTRCRLVCPEDITRPRDSVVHGARDST